VATGAAAVFLVAPGEACANLVTRSTGSGPLTDGQAAARVVRSRWEPRPENKVANHRVPTADEIAFFRAHSDLPTRWWVTGNHRGTTDEIIQWAAIKWGFSAHLFRAVAVVESWWKMSTVGDNGDSVGLFQLRRPYHCCFPLAAQSTAFNADYYGAILRAYYNGSQTWLNTVERGRQYGPGDIWGSVGVWASGRWYMGKSAWYVTEVRKRLHERTWLNPKFRSDKAPPGGPGAHLVAFH
jgi:hypothetical protein